MSDHRPRISHSVQKSNFESSKEGPVNTYHCVIPVRIPKTIGVQRHKPVTNWLFTGNYRSPGGLEKRFIQLRYDQTGEFSDGFLFRVPSNEDSVNVFTDQEKFVESHLRILTPEQRFRLAGKSTNQLPPKG